MDLTLGTVEDAAKVMADAVRVGAADAMAEIPLEAKAKTKDRLISRLGVTRYRLGHWDGIWAAYQLGRKQVEWMGM